jgi:hypothetical protein
MDVKNQTAIEWIEMEIARVEELFFIPNIIYRICEEAKEKEREQIMSAFEDGHTAIINSEQYYNETYGK